MNGEESLQVADIGLIGIVIDGLFPRVYGLTDGPTAEVLLVRQCYQGTKAIDSLVEIVGKTCADQRLQPFMTGPCKPGVLPHPLNDSLERTVMKVDERLHLLFQAGLTASAVGKVHVPHRAELEVIVAVFLVHIYAEQCIEVARYLRGDIPVHEAFVVYERPIAKDGIGKVLGKDGTFHLLHPQPDFVYFGL